MGVADTESEPASMERCFEFDDAEHLHAVLRYGVLFADRRNVPERQSVHKRIDHLMVRDDFVRCCSGGRRHEGELLAADLVGPTVGD